MISTGCLSGLAATSCRWIAFAAALLASRETLDVLWQTLRRRGLGVQAVVWVLPLPIVATLGLDTPVDPFRPSPADRNV